MTFLEASLLFHGALMLLVGLLAGIPYGRAINRGGPESSEQAWRVAHSALSMGGTTLIAVSAVLVHLPVELVTRHLLVWSFVGSSYGFLVALIYGAWVGHRGLSRSGPLANQVVFAGNLLGATGSLIGTLCLVYGSIRALLA